MDMDQLELRQPSPRLQARVAPYEGGYEWEIKEFHYSARRWVVIDSGASPHWAVALSDLAMAVSILAEGAF